MAITITPSAETESLLRQEAQEKGFPDLKKYITNIVDQRHNQRSTAETDNAEHIELLQRQLAFAINKAVKAGCNRSDLTKQINQIS